MVTLLDETEFQMEFINSLLFNFRAFRVFRG